jgi:hypothetical protein
MKQEDHEIDCPKHKVKRLLTKDYDKRGNQRIVKWGLWCQSCNVVIKQEYKHNPTKKQKDKQLSLPKLPKLINEYDGIPTDQNKFIIWYKKNRIMNVMGFRKQRASKSVDEKKRGPRVLYPEQAWILDLRRLAKIYREDEKYYPNLRGKINWDVKLVQEFIDIRPRSWEMSEVVNWPPMYRHSIKKTRIQRGHVPNPETSDTWIGEKTQPITIHDPNKLTDWEKLVIAEAHGRMTLMRWMIEKYHQSKIQIRVIDKSKDRHTKVELKTVL